MVVDGNSRPERYVVDLPEGRLTVRRDIRLDPVIMHEHISIEKLLEYYMGKNTQERHHFIIDNVRVEADLLKDAAIETEITQLT